MAAKPERPRVLKSSRTLHLRYDIPISKIAKFWDELQRGRITTTKCTKCGNITFPPAADCSQCRSSEINWIPLSGEAVLEAVTRIDIRPASFAQEEPYLVAIGRLKEGVNTLARLVGVRLEDAKVGMNLVLRPTRTAGRAVWYEFAPATGFKENNSS
ncbi:MAG: Zn-ribbon domain-containing OB-fold protein [Thaumarchaeota archaeon]|nr:Zn-ribbon domain-containing OB-fold protein [Nitrososphaerota archaeon]